MRRTDRFINTMLRIIVGLLLVGGLIFLVLSILYGRSQDYLLISLGMVCAGNFLNIYVIKRQKKE